MPAALRPADASLADDTSGSSREPAVSAFAAAEYDRWRPRYPAAIVAPLVEAVGREGEPLLVDVGSGTGIGTRLLREAFGPGARIVGVEPSPGMRAQARAGTPPQAAIDFRDGTAESIPLPHAAARLVLAAQSFHWFDRPAFLAEARRVLVPGGVLAVLHNDRTWQGGGVAAAYEELLERASPGYTRSYRRFDTAREFASAGGFEPALERDLSWERRLRAEDFPRFALTSSKTQAAVRALGAEPVRAELLRIAESAARADGTVSVPYVTRLTWARRRA